VIRGDEITLRVTKVQTELRAKTEILYSATTRFNDMQNTLSGAREALHNASEHSSATSRLYSDAVQLFSTESKKAAAAAED
jgi:hypothetical protein